MWTHRPLRDHLGSGVGTNKSDPLRPRDSRPETRFLFQHRSFSLSFLGGQAPFISVWDLDHCHVTFTIHKGIFSQICKSTNMKLWVNKSPSLVRHPISPTVCSTNIWRMGQVIKRIAFPSCFVTSLCHFNFSSGLYRLDTGIWILIQMKEILYFLSNSNST